MTSINLTEILKIIVLVSILFVWVIRYDNIKVEFEQYGLPAWLRDLIGILKISFVVMFFNSDSSVVLTGTMGIVLLMLAALYTHIRVKNKVFKMLPACTLMSFSLIIFFTTL